MKCSKCGKREPVLVIKNGNTSLPLCEKCYPKEFTRLNEHKWGKNPFSILKRIIYRFKSKTF